MQIIYRPPNSEKEFEEYFIFRWKLLRKPLGLERGSEKDELEDTTFHIAAYSDKKIIGVGRLQLEGDATARIRYMAVDSLFRKQGVGSRLLNELESFAKTKNIKVCWLYARDTAVLFYTKNNYNVVGRAESALEIPHKRMEKDL